MRCFSVDDVAAYILAHDGQRVAIGAPLVLGEGQGIIEKLTLLLSDGLMRVYTDGQTRLIEEILPSIDETTGAADIQVVIDRMRIAPVRYHKEKDADITVVYKHKPITDSIHRDVITISMDENKRVNGAFINPEQEEGNVLLNMTVISKRLLERIISEASSTNFYSFTRGVLQQGNQRLKIYGYAYDNYVADIKSLQSYYDCTMEPA